MCTSTRWRFLSRPFEERLEATGQEMAGCVPDIARYFRITDHLGMVHPGLDPVVGGFTVEISWKESIEAYVARVPDIPELAAWDETQEDALKKVRKAIRANIEIAHEYGDPVPEPSGC